VLFRVVRGATPEKVVLLGAKGLLPDFIAAAQELVHLGAEGQELPAPEAHQGFCLACHTLPQADLPAAPLLSAPAQPGSAIIWFATGDAGWRPAARAPPYEPTGPPAFS
jgi:hypothetical protein